MSRISNGVSLTIAGLVIAGLGVVAPIVWDLWSKSTELSIETKQSLTILQKEKSIQKLEISFAGKPISSLSKTILVLKNTGKIPVSKEDVVAPLTITFGNAEVLEVSITRQSPSNLGAVINSDIHAVTLRFDLLNPNDEVELSVLTAEGSPTLSADARIKNISKIVLTTVDNRRASWWKVGVAPYIAGIFGLIFFAAGIALALDVPSRLRLRRSLATPDGPILILNTKEGAAEYISTLKFLTAKSKSKIGSVLRSVHDELSDDDKYKILEALEAGFEEEGLAGTAFGALALGILGIWYAAQSFLTG